jgi:hypothetical protein
MAKQDPKIGDVFRFPLDGGKHGYGHVLVGTVLGFYAVATTDELAIDEVVRQPVAFRAACSASELRKGHWRILGNATPPEALLAPVRYQRTTAPGFHFLYEADALGRSGGDERRVSKSETVGVEEQGSYGAEYVLERLQLFLRGEPWQWVPVGAA